MTTTGQKTQFVFCLISFVIGLLVILASALFLDLDIVRRYREQCGNPDYYTRTPMDSFQQQQQYNSYVRCNSKLEFTIGGTCGIFAGLLQIGVAIAFTTSEKPAAWCLTSGVVWILTTAAFAIPMNSRADDLAVALGVTQLGAAAAMKIEFYLAMTAFNLVFTLFGIVLLLKTAEHHPRPLPQRQVRLGPTLSEELPSQIQARQSQPQAKNQQQLQTPVPDTRIQITKMSQQQPPPQSQAYPAKSAGPFPV